MECFLLGSGGMMPMPYRRLTSVAMRVEGNLYLFDCGEGTQVPYKQLHLGMRALNVIVITHLHADHILGLPGMMMLRAQMPDAGPLTIIGPPGIEKFIQGIRATIPMYINYPVEFIEWSKSAGEQAYSDERVRIVWHPVRHSVFCLGYRLEEHTRPGRFDVERAKALGVPEGPLFGKLQKGVTVTLSDGKTISPDQVMGPPRRGRHVAFITDTCPTPSLHELLLDVDLAYFEGMFLPEHEEEAREKKHMMINHTGQIAAEARVKKLILVHLSPRYDGRDLSRFNQQIRDFHENAQAGKDGLITEVPLPE